jgi:NAD-dependent SIR2 family protein deacetylase
MDNEIPMLTDRYKQAADAVMSATALVIGAGAGMGIDSGLPDFRGPEGFWKAYPAFRGKKFHELSTPHWFATDPQLAWGFFGHRWHLYRSAIPHDGFHILRNWAERISSFVFTSNVDGQFQKAGFRESQILECHGSIHYLQCVSPCGNALWSSAELDLEIDPVTVRTSSILPQCPSCRGLARPNVLMFSDSKWVEDRATEQFRRWQHWHRTVDKTRMVTIEIGAGLAVPTVRIECESLPGPLIRINPRDPDIPPDGISLPVGALEALQGIKEQMTDGFR